MGGGESFFFRFRGDDFFFFFFFFFLNWGRDEIFRPKKKSHVCTYSSTSIVAYSFRHTYAANCCCVVSCAVCRSTAVVETRLYCRHICSYGSVSASTPP